MSTPQRPRIVVLISGSGTNLQAIIDAQTAGQIDAEIAGVISDRPAAYGLTRATDAGIHATVVDYQHYSSKQEFNAALDQTLAALNPDLVVLAGYMRILPDATVNAYAGRMLNVHPSLLPDYPGLNTYSRAIAAGETYHGTTVHFVIPKLDAGPPILQFRVKIRLSETEQELRERVQRGEYIIYPQAIGWFAQGKLAITADGVFLNNEILSDPVVIDEEN
jgi:phosphoribosylglycinamide formyltransferase-1